MTAVRWLGDHLLLTFTAAVVLVRASLALHRASRQIDDVLTSPTLDQPVEAS